MKEDEDVVRNIQDSSNTQRGSDSQPGPPDKPPGKPKDFPGNPNPPGPPKDHPGKPKKPPGNPDRPGPPKDFPGRGDPPPRRVKPEPTFGVPSPVWWLEDPERWEYECRQMKKHYPGWQPKGCHPGEKNPKETVAPVWVGSITPLALPSDALAVISSLAEDRYVQVHINGRVDVDPEDLAEKTLDLPIDEKELRRTFFLLARHEGPPSHPKVFMTIPQLPGLCPHVFGDSSLCPLLPSLGAWSWDGHSLVNYLDHIAIWLVKFSVWDATQKATGYGVWIGREALHHRILLSATPPNAQCYCGSGLRFEQCHGRITHGESSLTR